MAINLQSTAYRVQPQNNPVKIGDLLKVVNDLEKLNNNSGDAPGGGTIVGVQGTGTVGTIARFTPNGTSIGDSQIIDDGTTSPTTQGLTFGRGNNNEIGNAAFGYQALAAAVADGNAAFGYQALKVNTAASNSAFGFLALGNVTTGMNNTAIGTRALEMLVAGDRNIAVGYFAGRVALGTSNSFIGDSSGLNQTTGDNNTYLGFGTGLGIETGSGNTVIGANVAGLAAGLTNNVILADGTGTIRFRFDNEGIPDFVGATVTTETLVSDTTIIFKVAGTSYKFLATTV